ncbi:MAG: hypothetical protein COA57_13430 [Flavobacteriales bacterium]|nr:T9SS type A sorting domain-containing protein [Bacteroidales bacterium AH-315-I05]PCJ82167.1 MAG: hypothetical protein COA57_13430 [Flavobacteriales bacterium]
MKKRIIQTILLLFIPLSLLSQWNIRQEKYWIYRERVKNFVVSEQCQGCGIPANNRNINSSTLPADNSFMEFGDAAWNIGYWIGTLAMEYKMLTDAGADVTQTTKDLYWALKAINRIDFYAEGDDSWDCTKQLNGFMIRDDVDSDFPSIVLNNKPVNDLLNESWVPPPDGARNRCINSAFTHYLKSGGEISQDHYTGIFIGLTLVKKLVPPDAYYDDLSNGIGAEPFMDQAFNFVAEVQLISSRIIGWLSEHAWILWNPCEGRCVHGVGLPLNPNNHIDNNPAMCNTCSPFLVGDDGLSYCNTCNPFDLDDNCCFEGGAITLPQVIGFTAVNAYIQGYSTDAFTQHTSSVKNSIRRPAWNGALIDGSRIPVTLAALGNIWDFHGISVSIGPFSTVNIIVGKTAKGVAKKLVKRGEDDRWEHLILLHRLIYGTQTKNNGDEITIPESYYDCLLDAAPCRGFDGTVNSGLNTEWGCVDRLAERSCGSSDGGWTYASTSGIPYMFYFNLYSLVFSPTPASNFAPLDIENLAPVNVDKVPGNNHVEYDIKNYMASTNINAYDYTVDSDPSIGQGRVTFVAGQKVVLGAGFKAINGAYFHGYIDPTINAMACTAPTTVDCSSFLKTSIASTLEEENDDVDTLWWMNNTFDSDLSKDSIPQKVITDNNVQIYPNPNSGTFTLSLQTENEASVYVMDVLGEIIYQSQLNYSTTHQIDLSNHPKGIYFVKVVSGDEIIVKKVVYQ